MKKPYIYRYISRVVYIRHVIAVEEEKEKKAKEKNAMKVILSTDEDTAEKQEIDKDEENIDEEEEDDEGGMHFEKDDVLLIYKALKNYKPVNDDGCRSHIDVGILRHAASACPVMYVSRLTGHRHFGIRGF